MATSKKDAAKGAAGQPQPESGMERVWGGGNPGSGVPEIFWTNFLQTFNRGGRIGKYAPDSPIAVANIHETVQDYLSGKLPEEWRGYLEEVLHKLADEDWKALPEAKRQEWTEAQERGRTEAVDSDAGLLEKKEQEERERLALTDADYAGWEDAEFEKFQGAVEAAAAGDQAALDYLKNAIENFKDPELAAYVGDYASQAASAAPSAETLAQQQASLDKLWGQTDVQETAEEKLMREMARRQQEQDLKGQRGAFANDLQARGVYGSGAELTMNLSAMQEAANRRALEEMKANANAQTRAMDALSQHGDLSAEMRGQEAQEAQFRGTAADKAQEFNKTMRESYNKWKADEERKAAEGAVKRAETLGETTRETNKGTVGNYQSIASTGLQGTIARGGAREGIAAQIGGTQGSRANLANTDELEDQVMA